MADTKDAMPLPEELPRTSPNGRHTAQLTIAGEIRFGPMYFELRLDGHLLANRFFGGSSLWSPNSRWLAVEEWLTISTNDGPLTQLVVFDVARMLQTPIVRADKGFLIPERFERRHILSRGTWYGSGRTVGFDHPLPEDDSPAWTSVF